ncbi:MAG: Gfo/Idh/MocA family oxidoreductase [Cyclobacteriaceae bacterium]|nr:Gfo/Idh/MocA family oxidoreductase [Cyclobacteriaceae bacterium]
MKKFALIGAAGFVAPRHLKAIKDTGNELVAAVDKFDSVGVMDSYFPKADFFTEFERFGRHIDKLKRSNNKIDYVSVCSPNYLHDSHIRFGLRENADVICEKPIVLNPWNVVSLQEIEKETGNKVFNILQLRLHPSIIQLKNEIDASDSNSKKEVDLTYITSRGHWYYTSWKGELSKSGGIATNIGIHFFDMLMWVFGKVQKNVVHLHEHDRAAGYLELEKARVRWFLSINSDNLPKEVKNNKIPTFRSIRVDNTEFEFSGGFTDLHTKSYENVILGNGFGLEKTLPSIHLAHEIRNASPIGIKGDYHPSAKLPLATHPFSVQ